MTGMFTVTGRVSSLKEDSMSVDLTTDYLQGLETISTLQMSSYAAKGLMEEQQNVVTEAAKDTYISSVTTDDELIPSGTYSDIMEIMKASKAAESETDAAEDFATTMGQLVSGSEEQSETASETTSVGTVSAGAASSGGSGSTSDSSETVTEIVQGQDGSLYEKTTVTASDGTETITMTKIADAPKKPMELQMMVAEMGTIQNAVESEDET